MWVAPIEDLGHTVEPAFEIPVDIGSMPQRLWVSATHVAVQTSLGLLFLSDGTTVSDPVYVADSDGPAQDGSLHDGHFLYEAWQTDHVRLAVASWGRSPAEILRAADPADVRDFGTDGHDMAWLEGYDYGPGGFARMELWTAPYATDPAAFHPRRVREIPSVITTGATGGAWFVKQSLDTGFDAWALADGTHRVWVPPPGVRGDGAPLYVTANEVCMRTVTIPYRIDPTTLPVVP